MEKTDYSELFMLVKSGEKALLSGELNEWQHACTSTFHLLSQYILDLNARLLDVGGAYPSTNQPILTTTDLEDGRDL